MVIISNCYRNTEVNWLKHRWRNITCGVSLCFGVTLYFICVSYGLDFGSTLWHNAVI